MEMLSTPSPFSTLPLATDEMAHLSPTSQTHLTDSVGTSAAEPFQILECPHAGCKRTFKREYNRTLHLKTHDQRTRKPFHCPYPNCNGLRFTRKHDLSRHTNKMHDGALNWSCDWCGERFTSSEVLVKHVRVHWQDANN